MKKLNLLRCLILVTPLLFSCSKEDEGDIVKTVEMTIYPETGYGGYFISDNVYGEFLYFSDSGEKEKRLLTDGGASFDDFDYEKGYAYKLRATKVLLKDPPQDGSSVRYEYLETLSKEKVITQNSEQKTEIQVAPEKVGFIPRSEHKLEQALFVQETGEERRKPLLGIEGFDYEEGYSYTLSVKKVIYANPYSVEYILLDILSKEKVEDY